ncbi:VWA domain-containing protein [Acidobacteria bacterium AH-259-D05]|nr:VWA domain-containing protein [Acidobacteria bacterium AH-259-D05]
MRGFFLPYLLFALASPTWLMAGEENDLPPRFRVNVDTVVVRITVTDPLNRYVVGLEKEHFRIYENKLEQALTHFSNDKSPISVGIILDMSGSMGDNILSARSSVIRFLEQGDPQDEYFLITFNERSALARDFTNRSENIRNEISIKSPKGRTALYDAMYLGMEKIREGRHQKKALIVITDGEDNSSRYTFSELKEFVKESDVQIYVIGERSDMGYGRSIISEIVRLTGARAFFPNNFKQLDYFCDLIHSELRNQYLVGYTPTNRKGDGSWRKIKVQLNPPEGMPKLKVRAKEGYFAPRK